MKITKYEHACFVVEEQGKRLIVDPGELTRDMGFVEDVVAVVFTHVHGDHFDDAQVAAIVAKNPGAQFLGTDEVAAAAKSAAITAVHHGDTKAAGPFSLEFFGEKHALVSGAKPDNQNVGVMVNSRLYYPGDSFEAPGNARPEVLALPISGPWLKMGEAIDLLKTVRPSRLTFPTHNGLLNDVGLEISQNWLPASCQELGVELKILKPGDSVEV